MYGELIEEIKDFENTQIYQIYDKEKIKLNNIFAKIDNSHIANIYDSNIKQLHLISPFLNSFPSTKDGKFYIASSII